MTVIAANLSVMAADSMCHEDDGSVYMGNKMIRCDDGSILGGAGNHPEIVMNWIKLGSNLSDQPKFSYEDDDFSILHLRKDGLYLYCNSVIPYKLKDVIFAVGSGAEVALYVMRVLKKSPLIAAREATKINMYCGGPIDVMKL